MAAELYHIQIKGHLDPCWADWFGGLALTHKADGTTVLCGMVVDQAALHGILMMIRDLGIPLLSVYCIAPDQINTAKAADPMLAEMSEEER
jgi:hypothetical protein